MKGKVDIEYDYYCNSSSNDSTNFIKQGIFVFLNECIEIIILQN